MPRRRRGFTARTKIAAFDRCGGKREQCSAPLRPEKFHYDHRIPDQLGGDPTLENCQVLCVACHGAKTAKQDMPAIAKAKRREASHLGAVAPPSRPIRSAGFLRSAKSLRRVHKPSLPPKLLFVEDRQP